MPNIFIENRKLRHVISLTDKSLLYFSIYVKPEANKKNNFIFIGFHIPTATLLKKDKSMD